MDMDMDERLFRQQHGWSLQLRSGQEIRLTPGAKEASEPLRVTDVFLVDPGSAAGQGVVAACVEIGTRNIILAALSSERPRVVLRTPVELDEEFCFYLMRPEGDHDADADAVVVQFQGYALPSANTEEEENDDDDRIDEVNHEEEEEEEQSDGDEDATDFDYEGYDSRDDGEVCGLPLGTVIEDGPIRDDDEEDSYRDGEAGGRAATANGAGRRNMPRRRRSFVTEAEGRSLGGPAPPRFALGAEHPRRRRVAPEAAVLGIFLFVYLMAMLALFIRG